MCLVQTKGKDASMSEQLGERRRAVRPGRGFLDHCRALGLYSVSMGTIVGFGAVEGHALTYAFQGAFLDAWCRMHSRGRDGRRDTGEEVLQGFKQEVMMTHTSLLIGGKGPGLGFLLY